MWDVFLLCFDVWLSLAIVLSVEGSDCSASAIELRGNLVQRNINLIELPCDVLLSLLFVMISSLKLSF